MLSRLWYITISVTLCASISICTFWFINDMPVGIKAIGICLILLSIAIIGVLFCVITGRYPRNNKQEFLCDFKKAHFECHETGCYIFELEMADKNVWIMHCGEVFMRFDMRGYMFPKAYICTFFILNIHYITLNALHLKFFRLFYSLKLDEKNKYKNVKLIFKYNGKRKTYQIVKNGKSKVTILRHMILASPYQSLCGGLIFKRTDGKMNDEDYMKGSSRVMM